MEQNIIRKNGVITNEIKSQVKSIYDFQKLRIAMGGRVIALFYDGVESGPSQDDERDIHVLSVKVEYNKLVKKKLSEPTEEEKVALMEEAEKNAVSKREKFIKVNSKKMAKELKLDELSEYELNVIADEYKDKIIKEYDDVKMEVLKDIGNDYKRITDAIVAKGISVKKYFENEDIETKNIRTISLYRFFSYYNDHLKIEEKMTADLANIVAEHPLWDYFLKDVKGCGPLMSGVCLSYFDVYKARHCSSFWKYAGMDVVQVMDEDGNIHGEARGKKHAKDNLVEYLDKNGEIKEKASLGYNPFLKSKLLGVLSGSFLRSKSPYSEIYYNRRNYLEQHPNHKDSLTVIKHRSALRYMVKMFVRDLWVAWRTIEGLEVTEPYEVAKLGMKPHGSDTSVK